MTFREEGNPLLQPVPEQTASQYYKALLGSLGLDGSLEVRLDAGGGRGKGVFTKTSINKGDVVLVERPLAAVQQLESKLEVSTCSHCFKAVGTVEQHVGGSICCLINELSEATEEDDLRAVQHRVDKIQAAVDSRLLEGLLSGAVQLPLTDKVDMAQPVKCRGGCSEEFCSPACEAEAWERYHCLLCPVAAAGECSSSSSSPTTAKGKDRAAASTRQHSSSCKHAAGSSSSSSSNKQPVLQLVHGVTVNRSKLAEFLEHADESNDIFRVAAQVIASTIVAADKLLQQQAADAEENAEAASAYEQALSAAAAGERTAARVVLPADAAQNAQAAAAYARACDHAAAASSRSSKRGDALSPAAVVPVAAAAAAAGHAKDVTAAESGLAAAAYAHACSAAQVSSSSSSSTGTQQVVVPASSGSSSSRQQHLAALQAAFLPFALGHKAVWWDVVTAQEAESAACSDQGNSSEELCAQLKQLAAESLDLLKAALKDERFPQLADLQLYASLVGMFELNNLALAVPAPVARYKAMLQQPAAAGLDPTAAAAALREVTPLLDALGDAADTPAEGTGFCALQSCMNHSCAPNAAASCLPDGQVIITALADIPAGAEVLLSYIEEEGADFQQRRAMLSDYGFQCACDRCAAEELAEQLNKHQLVAA